jgi:hypothetical protein
VTVGSLPGDPPAPRIGRGRRVVGWLAGLAPGPPTTGRDFHPTPKARRSSIGLRDCSGISRGASTPRCVEWSGATSELDEPARREPRPARWWGHLTPAAGGKFAVESMVVGAGRRRGSSATRPVTPTTVARSTERDAGRGRRSASPSRVCERGSVRLSAPRRAGEAADGEAPVALFRRTTVGRIPDRADDPGSPAAVARSEQLGRCPGPPASRGTERSRRTGPPGAPPLILRLRLLVPQRHLGPPPVGALRFTGPPLVICRLTRHRRWDASCVERSGTPC